jgi:hypothetical protein
MAAKMPSELFDRTAHLLFHASHAKSCLLRDFSVTIAVEAASEKYLPGQRPKAIHRILDAHKAVTRLEHCDRIAVAQLGDVSRDVEALTGPQGGPRFIAHQISRGSAKVGARCSDRGGFGRGLRGQAGKYLLDNVFGAAARSAASDKSQQPGALASVEVFDNGAGRSAPATPWGPCIVVWRHENRLYRKRHDAGHAAPNLPRDRILLINRNSSRRARRCRRKPGVENMHEHAPVPLAANGLDMGTGHPAARMAAHFFSCEVLTPRRHVTMARHESNEH